MSTEIDHADLAERLGSLGLDRLADMWREDGPGARDTNHQTPLHLLVLADHDRLRPNPEAVMLELVDAMLDAGVDPLARRAELYQETALTLALRRSQAPFTPLPVIERLARAQADWSIPYRYGTPLAIAYEVLGSRYTKEERRAWMRACAQILERHDEALVQGTAFEMICAHGELELIERAISLGADVDGQDGVSSPLMKAVEANRQEVVALLVEHGAQIDALTSTTSRNPAIHEIRDTSMFSFMIAKGADISIRNGVGTSAMAWTAARFYRHADSVPLLERYLDVEGAFHEAMADVAKYCCDKADSDSDALLDLIDSREDCALDMNAITTSSRTLFEDITVSNRKKVVSKRFPDPMGLKGAKTETHFKQLHKYLAGKKATLEPGQPAWRGAIKALAFSGRGRDKKNIVAQAAVKLRARVDAILAELLAARTSHVADLLAAFPPCDTSRVIAMLWLDGGVDHEGMTCLHYLLDNGTETNNDDKNFWREDEDTPPPHTWAEHFNPPYSWTKTYSQHSLWAGTSPALKVELANALLDEGAAPDTLAVCSYRYHARTPLGCALGVSGLLIEHGDVDLVRRLAVNDSVREPISSSPVNLIFDELERQRTSSEPSRQKTMRAYLDVLFEAGADMADEECFLKVCRVGEVDLVRLALARGASPIANGADRSPPLYAAVSADHVEVARLLLEHGATPMQRFETVRGWPMEEVRSVEMARLLVAHGDSLTARHAVSSGATAANHVARRLWQYGEGVSEGALEILEYFIEEGADMHATDSRGDSPYLLAIKALDSDAAPDGLSKFISRNTP